MKLNKISADMVSRRPDQTAEWLNRLKYSVEEVEASLSKGGGSKDLVPATTTRLGGIIVGDNLTITSWGRLSAVVTPGATTYAQLPDKPSINNVTLVGNKSLSDLGINIPSSYWGQTMVNGTVGGTLTLLDGGKTATISTTGHNSSIAGISMGNASNYIEAGITTTSVVSNTGDVNIKPKSGSSVNVFNSKITNLATPTNLYDAANKYYVDTGLSTKQDTLVAGNNINIAADGKTISAVVPTKTSDLQNDGSDGTSTYVEADDLATVATSGSYTDLINKPTIGNATLTIQKNSTNVGTFTANATSNKTIDISVPTQTSDITNNGADGTSTYVEADELATVAISGSYADLLNKPTIGNATLTIQKNGTNVDTFTANATSNKTINITVPTTAADVGALPDSTKYAASLSLTINSSTYVVTGQLKDQDGNNLGTAQTIDLPLESVVVSGSYDSATKEVVLVLENGSEIRFSVADLVSGLQSEITSANPLDADLVDDSTSTNKFVTASDISKLNGIQAGAEVNVQSNWTEADSTSDAYILNKPTIGNATLTIQQNGTNVQTFTANATSNKTANITVPTKTSDITNDGADGTSTYVENDDLTTALAGKQDTLTAGTNINLVSNTISTQTRGIEYIVGTQASATNLWTGVSTDNGCSNGTLYVGKTIAYYLPVAGNSTAATLNLTLPDGTTTGGIALRRLGGSTVTTHFGVNNVILMTYDGTYWKVSAYYDSNSTQQLRNQNNVIAAAAITDNRLTCGTSAGYKMVAANETYDINYPLLWFNAGSNLASGAQSNAFYRAVESRNLRNNKANWTGAQYTMTYLVGTLSGNTFTIDSDVFTQTVPTTEDGKVYTPIGLTYNSTYQIYFFSFNVYYEYKNGAFRPISHPESDPIFSASAAAGITSGDITAWNGKQDALTAGSNIQINGTTISATDTTYSVMTGAGSGTAGTAGLVPAPAAGDNTKYLSGDGTWKTVSQYALPIATANDLGGIKVGSELSINSTTGVLSANNNKVTQTTTKPATTTSYYPVSSTSSSTNTADVKKFSGYKLDYDDDEGGVAKLNLGYSSLNGSVAGKLSMIDSVSATGATTICGSGKASSTNHTLYSPDTSGRLVANSSDSTATGANNRPVYADANGVLQQINYTVDANVPSGAVFTDTTYSAGNGLTLTGTTFSVDSTVVALQSDIPTVNNATLTIQKNGTTVKTFTANASSNVTANITVPTKTSDITNDSGFITSSGTVAKADQLTTARTIAIGTGATGTATSFNGTSNITIPVTSVYETYLTWGNQVKNSSVSLIDAAMGEDFAANRLAYLPGDKITIEYSTDAGATWTTYTTTDLNKTALVTTSKSYYTGGASSLATADGQLRITITPGNSLYMPTRKLIVYLSTGGVSNATMSIERLGMNDNDYTEVYPPTKVTGWSGWNSFPISFTFGGSSSWSNKSMRLTFAYNGKSADYPNAQLNVSKIRLYGETAYSAPSTLATNGHLYSFDANKNATFPGEIVANRIYPNADSTYDLGSSSKKWRTLYLSGSIYHGSAQLSLPSTAGTLALTSDLPTVNNATLTIQKNSTNVATFTANASSNVTANISVPTKTSDLTNDSGFITDATSQNFAAQEGSTNPVFDDMTPIKTFTWTVADTTYRPVYQFDNTGWAYDNMDLTVAYRITVTGTGISQVTDVIDRWFAPTSWPVTSVMCRTLSNSAATTGYRYLRAVYPTSSGLNNNTYKIGQEISNYNATSRTIKVEVFKTATGITWNETKPAGPIYTSSTYQATNAMQTYSNRGWIFRSPTSFNANSADAATRVSSYESATIASSVIKSGEALTANYLAYQADDGKVYMISNTAKNMVCDENARIGLITTAYNNNTAIDTRYFRSVYNLSSTQVGYIPHATIALGDRVYLRCTMDSSGNIHSDNYLATSMAPGYTWVPFGTATASNTIYMDVRKPTFYTLNSAGDITHVNGKKTSPDITVTNTDPGEGVALGEGEYVAVYGSSSSLIDMFYPIGSYYETSNTAFDPNVSWGGTWVEDTGGRVLVAQDSGTFTTVGGTGGEETHQLVTSEMPSHSHSIFVNDTAGGGQYASPDGGNYAGQGRNYNTNDTGGGGAHNNLQPYIIIKRWHRVS